jgi:hypothetical protein
MRLCSARYLGLFAVFFGYFDADKSDPGENLSGQRIFTCLSYDVIAHETSHAVWWRLWPGDDPADSGTSDAAALSEGMADLIAILVRFSEPDVVARTIRTHGATLIGTPLLRIAMQFGAAIDRGTALREFPQPASREVKQTKTDPHIGGMVLTSAFIEALTGTYAEQIADLLRLNGGPPTAGNVHPDLVQALSDEAASLAATVARSVIAAIAQQHATKLGLDPDRPVPLAHLSGSSQFDSGGNLVSRVFVTLIQDDDPDKPRGVQLICDSEGDVQFVLGRRSRRRSSLQATPVIPEQEKFASSLSRTLAASRGQGCRAKRADLHDGA